jgi:hypothetical protein
MAAEKSKVAPFCAPIIPNQRQLSIWGFPSLISQAAG